MIYYIFALLSILLLHTPTYAEQILSYGFEDWDGSIHTTPDYPFGTDTEEYWCIVEDCNPTKYAGNPTYYDNYVGTNHEANTEVISSYVSNTGGTWTAHTGTYFLMADDDGANQMSPSVPGINIGTVNQQGRNLGENWAYGGLSKAGCDFSQITTGEIFLSFWARRNKGYGTLPTGTYGKWVVIKTDDSTGGAGIFFHVEGDEPTNTTIRIVFDVDSDGSATETLATGEIVGANDGAWHKWSFYVNFNTGNIKWWFDADDEAVDTPDIDYTGSYTTATTAENLHIQGNFSAQTPTESIYHALDDIEIWDGMPIATGDPSVIITSPTTGATYTTNTTPITSVSGTASDETSVSSVAWSCSTCTPTSGTATGTTSWSISSIGLAEGVNTITVTATDGDSNTGSDSIAVTYSTTATTYDWCLDSDGDDYYTGSCVNQETDPGTGWELLSSLTGGSDCNDSDATFNPTATQVCGNGLDEQTCGVISDDCPSTGTTTVYSSLDGSVMPYKQSSVLQLTNLNVTPTTQLGLAFPTSYTEYYDNLSDAGIGIVRLEAAWSFIEPTKGSWSWNLDARVITLQTLGIEPFITLEGDADWAITAESAAAVLNGIPIDDADWIEFCRVVAERYDGDGVDDAPGLLRPVQYYQVANEWGGDDNTAGGWYGTSAELITYINQAYTAIKGAYPSATFVLGGLASRRIDAAVNIEEIATYDVNMEVWTDGEITGVTPLTEAQLTSQTYRDHVDMLYSVISSTNYDVAAGHFYGLSERNQYRVDWLQQAGIGTKSIIVTEGGGPSMLYSDVFGEYEPEDHFRAVLGHNLSSLSEGIDIFLWTRFAEYEGDSVTFANQKTPLFDVSVAAKPGYSAYYLLAKALENATSVTHLGTDHMYQITLDDGESLFVGWVGDGEADEAWTLSVPTDLENYDILRVTDIATGTYTITGLDGITTPNKTSNPFVVGKNLDALY